jgi:hypothetical protein
MKAKQTTITVTETHYKKAMAAARRGGCITTTCVMAQALKARFPKLARTVSCGWTSGSVDEQEYTFDMNGTEITTLFTTPSERKLVLKMLPAKVRITPYTDGRPHSA